MKTIKSFMKNNVEVAMVSGIVENTFFVKVNDKVLTEELSFADASEKFDRAVNVLLVNKPEFAGA